MHVLIFLVAVSVIEICIWIPLFWKHLRKALSILVIILLSVVTGFIFGSNISFWTSIFTALSIYRVINLLRLVEGRTPVDYMRTVTFRSSIALVGMQALVGALVWLDHHNTFVQTYALDGLMVMALFGALFIVYVTKKHIREIRPPKSVPAVVERDLPSVSVLIPARNETEDLRLCLDSLLRSTYPKLEILVLDDCSQDKHTPQIIKEFAHDGVRFIKGEDPPKHWLAKTFAYQELVNESSGEILLFCGVDVRFEPHSVESMIKTLIDTKKSMMSVMPKNVLSTRAPLLSYLIQPVRYAWEITLPRNWMRRPPVLSTTWIIKRDFLKKHGEFKAISSSTSVESYFAKIAAKTRAYTFYQSKAIFGLTSHKLLSEQKATAQRCRYPQTHRRPEIVAVLALCELYILFLPYVFIVISVVELNIAMIIVNLLSIVLLSYHYVLLTKVTYEKFIPISVFLLPFAVIYDIWILNYSMWSYEFKEVIWKGRNICIPVMRYGDQAHQSSL
ncbi:MAG: glycosyltransferase family 2 protein [Candidatus Saccharimonadales bacterium]